MHRLLKGTEVLHRKNIGRLGMFKIGWHFRLRAWWHPFQEYGKDALFDSLFPDLKQFKDVTRAHTQTHPSATLTALANMNYVACAGRLRQARQLVGYLAHVGLHAAADRRPSQLILNNIYVSSIGFIDIEWLVLQLSTKFRERNTPRRKAKSWQHYIYIYNYIYIYYTSIICT